MKNIAIISDTHGYIDEAILRRLKTADEVWHAGDWGSGVAEKLEGNFKVRGVTGNIDGSFIRQQYSSELFFEIEQLKIFITHIGGYPGRYDTGIKEKLLQYKPDIFVCGHSHILKVMRDERLGNMLSINPGAAGRSGFHKMRTMIECKIENGKVLNMQAIELGPRTIEL